MKTCLLISTYDRYASIAEFAREAIDTYWAGHPEIYLCGCRQRRDDHDLPLRDDPRDWIGIVESAVRDLAAMGYTKCYYVMDDCPPLGPCNERALNETIPSLMDRLGASYISLVGWDQRRYHRGQVLGPEDGCLQRQAADFEWQYSTDPCLWNVQALADILAALAPTEDPGSRSAWAFERRLGRTPELIPPRWRGTSYKICAGRMLGGRGRWRRRLGHPVKYRLFDAARLATRLLLGPRRLARLDEALGFEFQHCDGPYPTYWAGVMTKGEFNPNVEKFLRVHGRTEYLRHLREHVAAVPPRT